MTLGQRISTYRKQFGLSQETLGERLGVSRQAVSKWETDAASPDMENLLALAREFGVSVAELTETPEEPVHSGENTPPCSSGNMDQKTGFSRIFWPAVCAVLAVLLVGTLVFTALLNPPHKDPNEESIDSPPSEMTTPPSEEDSPPQELPDTDFMFIFDGPGEKDWLTLGEQEGLFPFGTDLAPTEPEDVLDTDFDTVTLHTVDCGDIEIVYQHIDEEPERDFITHLTTISKKVRLPRMDIGVGSTKADVIAAYGDDLVYCLKESGSYTLVQHDYYYAYQTPETFGLSLCLFMRDGLVAGIRLEHMLDLGNQVFTPDHIHCFPLKNGEPDFSHRQEPERENVSDTRKVYIAWNQLVTNNNLSAEEQYAYRRDVFGLLPTMDWGELKQMSSAEFPDDAIFGLMDFLRKQTPYSPAELLWVQLGCAAKGLDGAYAENYCHILSRAFFSDPVEFAKALAIDGIPPETMNQAISSTAYDAELYPVELGAALVTLDKALEKHQFTESEQGWAKLLRLYLTTPVEEHIGLPKSPAELPAA